MADHGASGGSSLAHYIAALLAVSLCIVLWVAEAEIASSLGHTSGTPASSNGSSSSSSSSLSSLSSPSAGETGYSKPMFLNYLVRGCYLVYFLPWAVMRAARGGFTCCSSASAAGDRRPLLTRAGGINADDDRDPESKRSLGGRDPNALQCCTGATLRWLLFNGALAFFALFCGWTWYMSLPYIPVAANTAVYNSSPAFCFILAVIFVKERVTVPKVLAVILCLAGTVFVGWVGVSHSESSAPDVSTGLEIFGYGMVVLSAFLYGCYEVLYHNVTIRYPVVGGGAYRMVEEACLVIGVVGVWILSTAWVLIVIWDYAGIETFALPTVAQAKTLAVLVSCEVAFNGCLLLGITFSSALFVSVGCLMTIPVSVLADWVLNDKLLPSLSWVGIGAIVLGFLLLNWAQYKERGSDHGKAGSGGDVHSSLGNIVADRTRTAEAKIMVGRNGAAVFK